jgi:hypothetical protein
MNELDLDVSTEDVVELIASHSVPVSSEDLIDLQEASKTPPEAEDDYQSRPTKILTVKKMNEAFTYLEQFLSTVEAYDRMWREVHKYGELLIRIPILSGSPVITAGCVLRLRIEGMASRYGGWLRIY